MNVRSVTVFKKRKKQREVGVYGLGAISKFIRAQGNGISLINLRVFFASRLRFTMLFVSPPPPCKLSTLCNLADGLLVGPFISEFCCVQCMVAPLSTGISFTNACNPITHVSPMTEHPWN